MVKSQTAEADISVSMDLILIAKAVLPLGAIEKRSDGLFAMRCADGEEIIMEITDGR